MILAKWQLRVHLMRDKTANMEFGLRIGIDHTGILLMIGK